MGSRIASHNKAVMAGRIRKGDSERRLAAAQASSINVIFGVTRRERKTYMNRRGGWGNGNNGAREVARRKRQIDKMQLSPVYQVPPNHGKLAFPSNNASIGIGA